MSMDDDTPDSPEAKAFNSFIDKDMIDAMLTEKTLYPEESSEMTARRLFRENAVKAAFGVIHLSGNASSERLRFEAQKYILERVLGKAGDDIFGQSQSPITEFLTEVTQYVADKAEAI